MPPKDDSITQKEITVKLGKTFNTKFGGGT
jgi:hypothetical protein